MPESDIHRDGLRMHQWKRFLHGPDAHLVEELYVPALSRAVRYDRCCAYFSSQVLAVAARGFGGLIENLLAMGDGVPKPAVRLLVNEQLHPDDLEALLATGDDAPLLEQLLKRFRTPKTALEKNRLAMLGWLARTRLLEVRVGLMRHTQGMLHAKFGLVVDARGDTLAFSGSDNETGQALTENYEELQLGASWQDSDFVSHYRRRFDDLWADQDASVTTLPLPEAVRLKLISYAPTSAEPPRELRHQREAMTTAMLWHYLAALPYLPNGDLALDATAPVDLWPHQRRVVEDAARSFPAGRLLCDEVGLGKTVEAIAAIRRLLAGRGVVRALLLVPAGLLRQWQDELREKGGLLVPRWEDGYLSQPDGRREALGPAQALEDCPVLLVSREWARLPANRALLIGAPPWDLVLMDEAHAVRRREPEESAFNSGNLLFELLRELQLTGHTKGLLLLSATPMQTQPWEPWDLLSLLGVGGEWLVEFDDVRRFFGAAHDIRRAPLSIPAARAVAKLVAADSEFTDPPLPWPKADGARLAVSLASCPRGQLASVSDWLRLGAPLGRRMHRNTRQTLRRYHELGLSSYRPPEREVVDEVFDYQDQAERDCYEAIERYIDRRFEELEAEKRGKGFVMTIYRRRASSSPYAFRRSLERRLEAVEAIIAQHASLPLFGIPEEQVDTRDLSDAGFEDHVDYALPQSRSSADAERREILGLLGRLEALGGTDSKLQKFWDVLSDITRDGRAVLVFTEYTDTMVYLRDQLSPAYRGALGCYSGEGGAVWDDGRWHKVTKADITARLSAGELKVLVCTDAASEGLNLQAASALICYDLPWNPSKVEQRIGRIDRIGQQQSMLPIRNMLLANSIDMRVYTALRKRCGLFTHFVGPMQPVLAKAADILRGALRLSDSAAVMSVLEAAAQYVDQDVTVTSVFADAAVLAKEWPRPPVTRDDLQSALERLSGGDAPVRATKLKARDVWRVQGLGRKVYASLKREALERDDQLVPLVLGSPLVEEVAGRLPLPATSPLVIAQWSSGPFRCMEARWVHADGSSLEVTSVEQLLSLAEGWDGRAPSLTAVRQAEDRARASAMERVEAMQQAAQKAHSEGLSRQLEAARLRLLRELGRTLRCHGSGDLNRIFQDRLKRDGGGRFSQVLALLGGFPRWKPDELQGIDASVAGMSESVRNGRVLLGAEVEAAINDPRWRATVRQGT